MSSKVIKVGDLDKPRKPEKNWAPKIRRFTFKEKEGGTTYLFARPTFAEGFGSVVDVWGSPYPYNYCDTVDEADIRALKADMIAIGGDMNHVIPKSLPSKGFVTIHVSKDAIAKGLVGKLVQGTTVPRRIPIVGVGRPNGK